MKRAALLAVALLAVGSLVWASSQGETAEGDSAQYEITFGWFGERTFEDDPVYDIISEQFSVDIEQVPLSWQDRVQQVNLMVASGDMPDALFFDGPRSQYIEWARTGVIREIPTLPNSEYPNLSNLWDKMTTAGDTYLVDGKLYAWPKYNESNPVGDWWSTGFLFRTDWARALGMYQEQYTIDEMFDLAIAIVKEDPGNVGQGKVIGYADNSQFIYTILGYNVYASHFYVKDGEYVWGARDPETLQGLIAAKELYDVGGYWPDFYAATQGDADALFAAGQVGIDQSNHNLKNLIVMRNRFNDAHPDLEFTNVVDYMDIVGPDGKRWNWQNVTFWSASIFNPTVSDAKLDRILQVMDWIGSEDGVNTLFFGVPGVDWEYGAGGEPVALWETDESGVLKSPGYQSSNLIAMTLLAETYSWLDPSVPTAVVDMNLEHLERFSQNANIRPVDQFLDTFTGENWLKYGNALAWSEFQDMVKRIIPSTTRRTIEAEYKEWLDEIAPRVDAVLSELNATR